MVYTAGPESDHSPALITHQYTLTMAQEGEGIVIPAVGDTTYIEGKKVMLVAAPAIDCKFVEWQGDEVEDSESSPTQITMDGNKSVKAIFEAQATLTLVATGGGTTIPAPGVIVYAKDEDVTLKAVPNDGYEFKGWSGSVTEDSDIFSLAMDTDKTIGATFAEKAVPSSSSKKIYFATVKEKAFWNVGGIWQFFATPRHSLLKELGEDNHPQYLNETRHDDPDRHVLGEVVPHDSHTKLSDKGTNTHVQIDQHITNASNHMGSKSNPHGVTAAQTGALSKLSSDALPTASEVYRGQYFTVYGVVGPPAVADKLYYCRSIDGGTTFEWKEVSLV